jgi:hypothetical protein
VNLRRLFIINAVATFAAGVVLFLWPELMPGTVGIHLQPSDGAVDPASQGVRAP